MSQRKASSQGTYYYDPKMEADSNVVEIVGNRPLTCPALQRKVGPGPAIPEKSVPKRGRFDESRIFSFDITKAEEIFDHMLAAK